MVEDYLRILSFGENQVDIDETGETPLTDSITGMFSSNYNDQEYESLLEESLVEKHL